MTAKKHRRTLQYYRIRRIGKPPFSKDNCEAPILRFIYDFDYHVVAVDNPRARFATLWSLVRHPGILGRVPRAGVLRPWSMLSRSFVRRLQLEPEFVKTVILERMTKNGWRVRGTFHIQKGAVAYLCDRWTTPEPKLFGSLAAALAAAFKIEEVTVRPFLDSLSKANLAAYFLSIALTTAAALLFPIAVALVGDFLGWASRSDLRLGFQIFVAVVIISVGYAFFRLRMSRQRFYGAIELGVGIGMVIEAIRAPQVPDRFGLALKIMAAVYVIIRGLVNINEAVAKAREPLRAQAKTKHAEIMKGL